MYRKPINNTLVSQEVIDTKITIKTEIYEAFPCCISPVLQSAYLKHLNQGVIRSKEEVMDFLLKQEQ